jgi:hypothetical protein
MCPAQRPCCAQNHVPESLQTKDPSVEFVVVEDTKQLGMQVRTDPDIVMDVVNLALFTIQKGHEVLYSWTFGAIGGSPGTDVPKWLEGLVNG